jgi:hypothetical protein
MKKKNDAPVFPSTDKSAEAKPMADKGDVQQSNDERIDQDFPGFPHAPSTEKEIKTTRKVSAKN